VLKVALFKLTVLQYLPIQIIATRCELNPGIWEDACLKKNKARVDHSSSHSVLGRWARERSEPGSGPPQEMLENLSEQVNLSGDQKANSSQLPIGT
jgi:hypothetical protein